MKYNLPQPLARRAIEAVIGETAVGEAGVALERRGEGKPLLGAEGVGLKYTG